MRDARIVMDEFVYPTCLGGRGTCRIECIPIAPLRTVVIATELPGNTGMSITNAVEFVSTAVARHLKLDPHQMIWIEHYGYPDPVCPERPRTFDRVVFAAIHPASNLIFLHPQWRVMTDGDWRELGLEPPDVPVPFQPV